MATPIISIETARANEAGYLEFTVRLSEAPTDSVTVDYLQRSGTYVVNGSSSDELSTLTFAPGETVKVISVYNGSISDDTLDKSVRLELANPVGAAFPSGTQSLSAIGWVEDYYGDTEDVDRAVAISTPVIIEGAARKAIFTVSLSEAYSDDRTFSYSTYDGSAKAGSDYVAKTGNVTFAAGQTEAVVEVDISDGRDAEAAESFGLRLSAGHGLTGTAATAQILDNDTSAPLISVEGVGQNEGDYGAIVLRLSKAATDSVTVNAALSSDAADVSSYYRAIKTVTFAPGETVKILPAYIGYDYADELDRSFRVELSDIKGAIFGPGSAGLSAVGWALDYYGDTVDLDRAIAVSAPVVTEGRGHKATFTISLSEAFTDSRTFSYSTFDGTAVAGSDYRAKSGSVTFAAGQTEAVVEVDIFNDSRAEATEAIGIRLAAQHGLVGTVSRALVLDDDSRLPVVSVESARANEGDTNIFTVRLSKAATDSVTVSYMPVNGTATAYGAGTLESLVFAPGETVKQISARAISSYDDTIDRSYQLELSNLVGATFGGGQQTLSVIGWASDYSGDTVDVDRTISVTGGRFQERVDGEPGVAIFGVELSEAATAPITLNYKLTNGSARAGRDYEGGSGSVTFAAGQTHADVRIDLIADLDREDSETFTLSLAPPYPSTISSRTTTQSATATILDSTINGGSGNERLFGTEFADRIEGFGGNDRIYGRDGDDYLLGGRGNDRIDGSSGQDRIEGGRGDDVLLGGRGNDKIEGNSGRDRMEGGRGDDIFYVDHDDDETIEWRNEGYDTVYSSVEHELADHIERLYLTGRDGVSGEGNDLGNRIYGSSGGNTLEGEGGNDRIYGNRGNDSIDGGDGDDLITGGRGTDRMSGGDGSDKFSFDSLSELGLGRGRDVIRDFERRTDEIVLSGIDANTTARGKQSFDYIKGDRFSGDAGELRFASGLLSGDVDGDRRADFEIAVWDASSLLGSDLVL